MSTQSMTDWLTSNGYESPADAVHKTWNHWSSGRPMRGKKVIELPIPMPASDTFLSDLDLETQVMRLCRFIAEPGRHDGKKAVRFMGTIPGLEMEPLEVGVLVEE